MEAWLEHFARANFARSADTAHDLKTPLNVAVLNLELLRMRLKNLAGEDEKVAGYLASIELELRRLARIFDAFFVNSTPPKNEGAPQAVDVAPLCEEAAGSVGLEVGIERPQPVVAHAARIRQALGMFFEGASALLRPESRRAAVETGGRLRLTISGVPRRDDFELTKIFKFYYTDLSGNPDLALATARLIAETYGGAVEAAEEHGKVAVSMELPLGER
ncbi:MAG TPA: histidine kinase dimerization/phospho-acceptor domain-containing protein [Thermoanaerobaculia bacterium]|nr:histidine kinase dimerization/phospho-acceptor domain-containing protein [Thermoanaerobaculia bacterium]